MSDFIISLNISGEFGNFEDWDAAQEREGREAVGGLWPRCSTPADGVSPLSCGL